MKKIINKFRKDTSGNFAMMFAISLFPLMMAAGIALDYTQASRDKGDVQNAIDIATIAAAKNINMMDDDQLEVLAKDFLKTNLSATDYARLSNIEVLVNRASGKISVSANSYTPTSILAITGKNKFYHDLTTEVKIGIGDIEIAMVLDNTHSMSADGKIAALKTSATDFVNSLFEIDNGAGNLKISMVPFNQYVNVGMDNRDASWIDVPDDYSEEVEQTSNGALIPGSCETVTNSWDGVEYESEQCQYEPGETETVTVNNIWNGCVGSRHEPLNLKDVGYGNEVPGVLFKDYYAESNCPNELVPLTDEKATLLTKISEMDTSGRTYIPAGIMWGWRALSSNAPYDEGSTSGSDEVQKIMVLMTDGDNQASADFSSSGDWGSGKHWGDDIEEANTMTADACTNAKADDIIIYSITFGSGIAADTKTLMQNCATSNDNYFDASDADDLSDAFISIMKKIGKIRVST